MYCLAYSSRPGLMSHNPTNSTTSAYSWATLRPHIEVPRRPVPSSATRIAAAFRCGVANAEPGRATAAAATAPPPVARKLLREKKPSDSRYDMRTPGEDGETRSGYRQNDIDKASMTAVLGSIMIRRRTI